MASGGSSPGGVPTIFSVSWKGPWVPFPCRPHSAAPGPSREPSGLWRVEGGSGSGRC